MFEIFVIFPFRIDLIEHTSVIKISCNSIIRLKNEILKLVLSIFRLYYVRNIEYRKQRLGVLNQNVVGFLMMILIINFRGKIKLLR